MHEEKIYGARDARFAPDGKSIFVLVDEGSTSGFSAPGQTMLQGRTQDNTQLSNKTSQIKGR